MQEKKEVEEETEKEKERNTYNKANGQTASNRWDSDKRKSGILVLFLLLYLFSKFKVISK